MDGWTNEHIPEDPDKLQQLVQLQARQIDALNETVVKLAAKLAKLEGKDRTEELFKEIEDTVNGESNAASASGDGQDRGDKEQKKDKEKKPQTGHGPTPQPDLDEEEEVLFLDEPDKVCPCCGGELEMWVGQFEESELITSVEVRYVLKHVKQQKYRCRCGGCVETAPPPPKVIKGGRYSAEFAVHVAIAKYLDHLPLNRQTTMMARQGLSVQSQTLWDQIRALAALHTPVYDSLHDYIVSHNVIGLDQTSWPRLVPKKSRKRDTPWQMWGLTTEDAVYYAICEDKSAATALDLLGDFAGVVVCDQLSTHGAAERHGAFELAGCLAHIVRRFRNIDSPKVEPIRRIFKQIYEIDSRAGPDLDQRQRLRDQETRPLMKALKQILFEIRAPKTTALGKAVRHTLRYWERLTRFVDDPEIWLDNNITERALRGPVVGRKNHYGSRSKRGTQVAAVLYSLLETAKVNHRDPSEWLLKATLAKLQYNELILPWE
jgi:transposase